MQEFRVRTSQRPRPLPPGHWAMTHRWNDLLFAHWPVSAATLSDLLPEGLQIDTYDGSGWLGITPFWIDRVKFYGAPRIPGLSGLPELILRTYVRDKRNGTPGIYAFSLDCGSLLAALGGRVFQHMPCHWAEMQVENDDESEREISFFSRRHMSEPPAIFQARYRGLGPSRKTLEASSGSLEYFLMERNCIFTRGRRGSTLRANLHQLSWPLEDAAVEVEQNTLADSIGIPLSLQPPVVHYVRRLVVYVWPQERIRPKISTAPVRIAVTPS